MEEDTFRRLADADIEILPPETCPADTATSQCLCCGRPASGDEDCYGICEECLSP